MSGALAAIGSAVGIAQSASLLFNSSGNITGESGSTVIPDIVARERHIDTVAVTSQPVEFGAAISDHAFKMPAQLELSYGWSNASVQALADVSDSFADSSSLQNLGEGYVRKVYDALLDLQKRRELCTIVTMKHLYKNMIITSVATETTSESAYSMFVTATCQEVLMARTVIANASATPDLSDASTQATPANTQSVLYMGTKQLTPVNNPTLNDTYSKWAGMIGIK